MTAASEHRSATYELPRGMTLGKYEILRRIATGGMAEIYLARVRGTAGFEKLVVLKRILPSVAEDPKFVAMFLDEARLAATLQHPNIADVYDVGEADGAYFFTMEYVHGQDVRSIRHETRKRDEAVPLSIALAIAHGTCAALDYAHERKGADGKPLGLVHRDVSSSNILVSYDGAIKLVDFGIARASTSQHKTQTGTLKGKIPYMSPEQCKGLPMDRRSDLFSLGVVLYELTAGRRPFRGETEYGVMEHIVHGHPQPPSQLVPDYPAELEEIVMKLLAREPGQRYASGEVVLHDLEELIAQHRLWITAKPIGKYMRTVFADRIAAWDAAEQRGVPFIQHVAQSITSESQRSEMYTPPSAYPGLPAFRDSQVVITPGPLSASQPAVQAVPDLRGSSRRSLWIAAALIVVGLGGAGAYFALHHETVAAVAPPPSEAEVKMTVTQPLPPPTEVPAPISEPKPAIAKPAVKAEPAAKASEPARPPAAKPIKPKPRPVKPKPTDPAKESTWDPNSLFLPPH